MNTALTSFTADYAKKKCREITTDYRLITGGCKICDPISDQTHHLGALWDLRRRGGHARCCVVWLERRYAMRVGVRWCVASVVSALGCRHATETGAKPSACTDEPRGLFNYSFLPLGWDIPT